MPTSSFDLLSPAEWADYQLIDCGNFEKLERFGPYVVARPEPQAIWDKSLDNRTWQQTAAHFHKDTQNTEKGFWEVKKPAIQSNWHLVYPLPNQMLRFKLSLSSFKHVGVFPEQACNWDYIYEVLQHLHPTNPPPKVLNLFAYTGGASLAAKAAGADVLHVDAVKPVISWARENMELSHLQDIRWVVEDALTFVKREVKRQNTYQGIILDPPTYGRGPKGEKWLLEDMINDLLKQCALLADEKNFFLIINLYAIGFSALVLENLINQLFKSPTHLSIGELYLNDQSQKKLPLGVFARFRR